MRKWRKEDRKSCRQEDMRNEGRKIGMHVDRKI